MSPVEPNPRYIGPPLYTDLTNRHIQTEIEKKLGGDSAFTGTIQPDLRVLPPNNPNHYFVKKTDFNSP